MSAEEPIASATLAQLYLAQGHLGRAAAVVERVLAERPYDGQALVLRDRLAAHSKATLVCELGDENLVLRWQGVPEAADVHLVFAAYLEGAQGPGQQQQGPAGQPRVRVTSRRCKTAFGEWICRRPMQPGTAIACLVSLQGHDLEVLAVAPISTWE